MRLGTSHEGNGKKAERAERIEAATLLLDRAKEASWILGLAVFIATVSVAGLIVALFALHR